MTGFGRSRKSGAVGSCQVEMTSVNRRHLELQLLLPPPLQPLIAEIRSWLSQQVERGHLKLQLTFEPAARSQLQLDEAAVAQLSTLADQLASSAQISKESAFSLLWNRSERPPLQPGDEPDLAELTELARSTIEEALSELNAMRESEGGAVQKELLDRCRLLEGEMAAVERLAPAAIERHRTQLEALIEGRSFESEEAVANQLLLFANKVDIAEEISRFRLHLGRLRSCSSGKQGEFLLQELLREVNTLGSKANDGQISLHVIAMKGELERLREQMQNIE